MAQYHYRVLSVLSPTKSFYNRQKLQWKAHVVGSLLGPIAENEACSLGYRALKLNIWQKHPSVSQRTGPISVPDWLDFFIHWGMPLSLLTVESNLGLSSDLSPIILKIRPLLALPPSIYTTLTFFKPAWIRNHMKHLSPAFSQDDSEI